MSTHLQAKRRILKWLRTYMTIVGDMMCPCLTVLYVLEKETRVGWFYLQELEGEIEFYPLAKGRIKGLIKCPLNSGLCSPSHPATVPALEPSRRGCKGILLFASSVHLHTPNWAATSNTCINHPCSGGLQVRERGPWGGSPAAVPGGAGREGAEVRESRPRALAPRRQHRGRLGGGAGGGPRPAAAAPGNLPG